MKSSIEVQKSDGTREQFDPEKIHKVVQRACEGHNGVSVSEIEMKSNIQIYNGIKTSDIHDLMIKAAADLISERTPNYQYVAARLLNYKLRKNIYACQEIPHLSVIIEDLISKGKYDPAIAESMYTPEQINELNSYIKHERDDTFTYVAMEQLIGKYLCQNRDTGELFETPQTLFMMVSAVMFHKYPEETRMSYVKRFYDAVSTFRISLPTPVMAGVRTPVKQFSSCVLIEADDSLDSIIAASGAIVKYISRKAGIGLGAGSIRAEGSSIGDGTVVHTGNIPFLKYFLSSVKSCSQGGVRGGSATTFYPIWHLEFPNLIVLKNNKGTDETRVRHMDYGFQLNKLMYERLLTGGNITLFSPNEVPGLYDAFFADQELFEKLYVKYENDSTIRKSTLPAIEIFSSLLTERSDTGRIYIQNVDHANSHSPFITELAPIRQSNLCCLTGDSKLDVLIDGNPYWQMQLIDVIAAFNLGQEVKIMSYNIESNEIEYKEVTDGMLTRKNSELYEITDVNTGKSLKCTYDHKIFTKNRGYVEAQHLTEEDELVIS